jgi:hypothetical protein
VFRLGVFENYAASASSSIVAVILLSYCPRRSAAENGSRHIQNTFRDVGHEDRALQPGTGAGQRILIYFSEISSNLGTRERDA